MKTVALVAAFAAAVLPVLPGHANDVPITIGHPWLRATPRATQVVGGYATITNNGSVPDRLVSASLAVAKIGQIHSMTMNNGIMEMRRLDDGLVIAPGATVLLQPGGDHLMFLKPTVQLKEGESMRGTLTFEKAGTLPVTFAVGGMADKSAPGTKPAAGGMARHEMGGMSMH